MMDRLGDFDGTGHLQDKSVSVSEPDSTAASARASKAAAAAAPFLIKTPGPYDVVLGRGRGSAMHSGNKRLQSIIKKHLDRYQSAPCRKTKTSIINEILDQIKNCPENPGLFLKYDKKQSGWIPEEDNVARLKISQAIRYGIRTPASDQQQQNEQKSAASGNRRRKRDSIASTEGQPNVKRLISSQSSLKSDPKLWESSEQSMLPPPGRRSSPQPASLPRRQVLHPLHCRQENHRLNQNQQQLRMKRLTRCYFQMKKFI